MQDIATKTTGSTLTADEFNQIPSEIENAIKASGIALSAADLFQLSKSIANYSAAGDYYTKSGNANTYTLTPVGLFNGATAYHDGARFRTTAIAINTGAVTVAVGALGSKNAVKLNSSGAQVAFVGGEIKPGPVEFVYDLANDKMIYINVSRATEYYPRNYLSGFLPVTAADAANDLQFGAGECYDSTNTFICKPTWASLEKRLDATWAEGNAQGGMSSAGAVAANTVYYWNLIRKDSDPTIFDIVIDVTSNNTNTPAGWTFMRRLWVNRTTSASAIQAATYTELGHSRAIKVAPSGDYFAPVDLVVNPGNTLQTWTAGGNIANMTPPPGADVDVTFRVIDATAASTTYAIIRATSQANSVPSQTNNDLAVFGSPANDNESVCTNVIIDASRQATYRLSQSTVDHLVSIVVKTWRVYR